MSEYTRKDMADLIELSLVEHAISDVLRLICPPGSGPVIRELAATHEAIRALNTLTNQIDVLKRGIQTGKPVLLAPWCVCLACGDDCVIELPNNQWCDVCPKEKQVR